MISETTFTKEWIQKKSNQFVRGRKKADPTLYDITDVERFDPNINLREYVIEHPDFKKLKSIMKFDPEAYFYWYKGIELLSSKKADASIQI